MYIYNSLENSTKTFYELSQLWLLTKKDKLKPSSFEKYKNLLSNHIVPKMGNVLLKNLSNYYLDYIINMIYHDIQERHLSCSLMKSIVYIINSVLKYGKRLNIIASCVEIDFEITNTHPVETVVLQPSEIKMIMDYFEEDRSDNNLGILISLFTGLRIGEICALQRKDIDFDENVLYVRKTVQRLKFDENEHSKLIITSPKSHKSLRVIPLPTLVRRQLIECGINKLDQDYFVLGKRDIPYEPRTLQYAFSRLLNKCHIRHMNFHCLRHTFATNCLDAGFDIKTLSEILGHSNVAFTMNRYIHSNLNKKRAQMILFESQMMPEEFIS